MPFRPSQRRFVCLMMGPHDLGELFCGRADIYMSWLYGDGIYRPLPKDTCVIHANWSVGADALEVLMYHESFDLVAEGVMAPFVNFRMMPRDSSPELISVRAINLEGDLK